MSSDSVRRPSCKETSARVLSSDFSQISTFIKTQNEIKSENELPSDLNVLNFSLSTFCHKFRSSKKHLDHRLCRKNMPCCGTSPTANERIVWFYSERCTNFLTTFSWIFSSFSVFTDVIYQIALPENVLNEWWSDTYRSRKTCCVLFR